MEEVWRQRDGCLGIQQFQPLPRPGGIGPFQGMQQALGQPLNQVEDEWRASVLGESTGMTAFSNLFPYIAILIVLLSVSLVSALTFKRPQND